MIQVWKGIAHVEPLALLPQAREHILNDIFSGVAKANLLIDVVSKAASCDANLANCNNPGSDSLLAELRTLRAVDPTRQMA